MFTDIASMVVADAARGVKDDESNLRIAASTGAFAGSFVPALVELNALRNVLVHEYDGVDHARATESAARRVPVLRAASKEVREWISRK